MCKILTGPFAEMWVESRLAHRMKQVREEQISYVKTFVIKKRHLCGI